MQRRQGLKLSIVTINYNDCDGLARTIKSVVGQTCRSFEYIVIDGASTDGSLDVIRQFEDNLDYFVSEPDTGIYQAMNKGIDQAGGEYLLFMNSGDTFHTPDVVEQVLPLLQGLDFYGGAIEIQTVPREVRRPPREVTFEYMREKSLYHQATFIKTSMLKVRPYNETFRIISDWEQMFYELIIHNATYQRIDLIIADFAPSGISANKENWLAMGKAMYEVVQALTPQRLLAAIDGSGLIEGKIIYAVNHKKGFKRFVKILRNAFKLLIRDLIGRNASEEDFS
ncbi:MAG: glycosyltransferase [Bacteroidales bacterium]|nr:glycosyltransferase [Bacteroidales bacterium]